MSTPFQEFVSKINSSKKNTYQMDQMLDNLEHEAYLDDFSASLMLELLKFYEKFNSGKMKYWKWTKSDMKSSYTDFQTISSNGHIKVKAASEKYAKLMIFMLGRILCCWDPTQFFEEKWIASANPRGGLKKYSKIDFIKFLDDLDLAEEYMEDVFKTITVTSKVVKDDEVYEKNYPQVLSRIFFLLCDPREKIGVITVESLSRFLRIRVLEV